jgi:hypothetical protein
MLCQVSEVINKIIPVMINRLQVLGLPNFTPVTELCDAYIARI